MTFDQVASYWLNAKGIEIIVAKELTSLQLFLPSPEKHYESGGEGPLKI